MSRAKPQVLAAASLLFALWPLVHIGLVKHYGLSPWKLAGWGMYAAPRSRSLGMEILGRGERAGAAALEQLTRPTPQLRDEASRFLERHRWLHRLVRPDALVAATFAEQTGWTVVKVVLFEPELVRDSGMIEMRALVHRYERAPGGGDTPAYHYLGTEDAEQAGLPPSLLARLGGKR